MDKRWYGIIIILIVGISLMYLIAITSDTVGSAIVIVDDVSVTVPSGFIIGPKDTDKVMFINDENESIGLKYLKDGNNSLKEYDKKLKSLENISEFEILKKTSNTTMHSINYKNTTSNKTYLLNFFDMYDRTLMISSSGYKDLESQKKAVSDLMSTIKPDYKQSRS